MAAGAAAWARGVAARLRDTASSGAALVAVLEEVAERACEELGASAALGAAGAHKALLRLTAAEDEVVAEAAGLAVDACLASLPPGAPFPADAGASAEETPEEVLNVGRLATPCVVRLRRAREAPTVATKLLGNVVWPSAVVLARWLCGRSAETVQGRDVLEIGAGLGLVGITAALLDARHVRLTDRSTLLCENLRYNAELNGVGLTCDAAVLDWDEDECAGRHDAFDVVLGADVVHEEPMAEGVLRALRRHVAPGGRAIIVNPAPEHREGCATFQALLEKEDDFWASRVTTRLLFDDDPLLLVGLMEETEDVALDLYVLTRASS